MSNETALKKIFGKHDKSGVDPAIILMNPKFSRNVSQAVRACSCFGFKQCWFTGERVQLELNGKTRLPREERMKGYSGVDIYHHDKPFERFGSDVVPIGVDLVKGAGSLFSFEHPKNAVYVFGPEDGSLPKVVRSFCHQMVFIPMAHCCNLASATYLIMYDRAFKQYLNGEIDEQGMEDVLKEPRGWQNFENEYYGNLDDNHRNTSVGEMLDDK